MEAKKDTFYFKHRERLLKEAKIKIKCDNCDRYSGKSNMYKHKKTLYCKFFNLSNTSS